MKFKKNPLKPLHIILLHCFILLAMGSLKAQDGRMEYHLYFQSILKGHPLIMSNGAAVGINYDFIDKENYRMALHSEFGFYQDRNIETDMALNVLLNLKFIALEKLALGFLVGPTILVNKLHYEKYIVQNNTLRTTSNTELFVRPYLGANIHYQLMQLNKLKVSGVFRGQMIQWNSSYSGKLSEGFKVGYSVGLVFKWSK